MAGITSDVMEMKVLYNSAPTWELEKAIAIMMKMLVLSVSEIQVAPYNNNNWTMITKTGHIHCSTAMQDRVFTEKPSLTGWMHYYT